MAVDITTENFEAEVKKSSKPVVIDFFATWCGPCQQVGPVFDELEKDLLDKYKFAKVNIDEQRDLAIKHNVSSVPTFIFIKDGEVVGREQGYMDNETLKKKIEGHLE